MKNKIRDMRDTIFLEIIKKAKKNKNIIIVSIDYGSPVLDDFRASFPSQFINAGICEQSAVSIAAGLASEGKIVYLYSILTFIVCRSFEQLKLDVGYNNYNINIIGVGPGFAYGQAGPTHHSLEDVSLIRSIKNSKIIAPSDSNLAKKIFLNNFNSKKFNFFRLERGILRENKLTKRDLLLGFRLLFNGKKNLIISYGEMISRLQNEIEKLNQKKNFTILDNFVLKPINKPKIKKIIKSFKNCIVIEEQIETSGISNIISDIIIENKLKVNFRRFYISEKDMHHYKIRDKFYADKIRKLLKEFC